MSGVGVDDMWQQQQDGCIGDAFEKSCELNKPSASADARRILVQMVRAYTDGSKGGVILHNTSKNFFLALDIYAPLKGPSGEPMIKIQYAYALEMGQAEMFLRDEAIQVLDAADDVVKIIDQHIRKTVPDSGKVDILSGCRIFMGSFGPMKA
mmetsp:Transcript_16770/g.25207  ORF Transcript_16770/g.25207 Transcript_16770/m.25207 type:complete len:152 (-) Transcript_16770:50-505(-)